MTDPGWAQAYVAAAAAVIAIGAALLSAWQASEARKQAVQATRQADAAHGDVEPTFHLEPIPDAREEWALRFVARNFNRHAVLLDTLTIDFPDTFLILAGTRQTRTTRQAVEGFVQQTRGRFANRPQQTMPGLAPGGENAASIEIEFSLRSAIFEARTPGAASLQTLSVVKGDTISVSYSVVFKVLDGLDIARAKSGKLSLVF